ncbi:uncharacterized protein LOC113050717 [Carassius auratus]|uniref:Uncharacterized protein LOC113050717 n=1 Tax=Carassius auratus TaxID=7957 RepID=A0A6P6KBZ6_CARAU|nr:uncharacterized protein LOC113050717 [Carassius auratus]
MQFPVLLFISSVSAVVGIVSVLVTKPVISYCHQAITLHCNVSLFDAKDHELQVTHLSWIKESNKTVCSESMTAKKGSIYCQYMPNKQLVLNIAHPKSDDIGRYICKLRSSYGHASADTNVTLECPQEIVQINEDGKNRVTCKVGKSNHHGRIHWFNGKDNLTSQSTQDISSAADGSYTVINKHITHHSNLQIKDQGTPTSPTFLLDSTISLSLFYPTRLKKAYTTYDLSRESVVFLLSCVISF